MWHVVIEITNICWEKSLLKYFLFPRNGGEHETKNHISEEGNKGKICLWPPIKTRGNYPNKSNFHQFQSNGWDVRCLLCIPIKLLLKAVSRTTKCSTPIHFWKTRALNTHSHTQMMSSHHLQIFCVCVHINVVHPTFV